MAAQSRAGSKKEPFYNWTVLFTKQAQNDAKKIVRSNLREKAEALLAILARDPFQKPPPYEKLVGDLAGAYSRRINIQHRLVYQIYEKGSPNVDPLRLTPRQ